jgi:hypothetical protein
MNCRKLMTSLGPSDVWGLSEAVYGAASMGLPLTGMLTIHFSRVSPLPEHPGDYLRRSIVGRLGVWCRRRGLSWTAIWVRENYAGGRREHLHVLLHVPGRHWAALCAAVRRWWPEPDCADLRRIYNLERVLRYISKQLQSTGGLRGPAADPPRTGLSSHRSVRRRGFGQTMRNDSKPPAASRRGSERASSCSVQQWSERDPRWRLNS